MSGSRLPPIRCQYVLLSGESQLRSSSPHPRQHCQGCQPSPAQFSTHCNTTQSAQVLFGIIFVKYSNNVTFYSVLRDFIICANHQHSVHNYNHHPQCDGSDRVCHHRVQKHLLCPREDHPSLSRKERNSGKLVSFVISELSQGKIEKTRL